jgi:hypothetical protein
MADNMIDAVYRGVVASRQREAYNTVSRCNATIREQNEQISGLCRQVEAGWAEIARLKDALALSQMEAAGRDAQADAMKAQHPASPLLADSGQVYSDAPHRGEAKTKLRLIYEQAHDAKGRSLGIINPAVRRLN